MKKVFFLFLGVIFFGHGAATLAQSRKAVFTSFRFMESVFTDQTVFKGWKNETLILPIRISSFPSAALSFDVKSSNPRILTGLYQLHYLEGDISAGYCGSNKSNGVFEKRQFPDRAEKLSSNIFLSDSANHYVLLELRIDEKATAGKFPIEVVFSQGGISFSSKAIIQVLDWTLPDISKLKYKVDFWQFPMSTADYYQIKPWSEEHLTYMWQVFLISLKGSISRS